MLVSGYQLLRDDSGWLALGFLGCTALYNGVYRWVAAQGSAALVESTFGDDVLEPQPVPLASHDRAAD